MASFDEESKFPLFDGDALSFTAHSLNSLSYTNEVYNANQFNTIDIKCNKNTEFYKSKLNFTGSDIFVYGPTKK